MGIAPAGKHVTTKVIAISRVEKGKLAETGVSLDALGLLQQLGVIPQMAQARA